MTPARVRIVTRLPGARAGRQGQNAFFVTSLVLHLAFAATIILFPSFKRGPRIDPDAIAVSLTGALPRAETQVARPAPPPEPAPEPVPEVAPEGASLEPKQIKITRKPQKKEPEPKKASPPKPVQKPEASGTGSATDAADLQGAGAGEGGSSIASLDLDNVALAWYASSVTASLRSQWIRPPLVNVHDELSVIVAFEILRNGTVRNIRIESSSGVRSLDRSALRAVTDASPLPPLPSTVGSNTLPARFEFTWYPGTD